MSGQRDAGGAESRRWWRQVAREPLVHFALVGGLLFVVHALVGRDASAPGERVTEAAIDRTVAVSEARVARLRDDFRRSWRRPPSRDELAELLLTEVSEELLHREALALGLDRDDPVLRRRLVDKMRALARGVEEPGEPSAAELRRFYDERPHRFAQPARVWFEQLFFDAKLRGPAVSDAARAALADPSAARPDPSPLPRAQEGLTELQLAHQFGEGFVAPLFAAPTGAWHGPISSTLGLHLVRVSRQTAARVPPFEEVERQVRADWLTEQRRGLFDAALRVRPKYRIELPPAVQSELAGAPLARPLLEPGR